MSRANQLTATQMFAFYKNANSITSENKIYRDNSKCPYAIALRKASNLRHDTRLQVELDNNDLSKHDPFS